MDSRDFIEEYKDFNPDEIPKMLNYIQEQAKKPMATKIHIRRWPS